MAAKRRIDRVPFHPRAVVLNYELEQSAHSFSDSFERDIEQWRVTARARSQNDGLDEETACDVGWASLSIVRISGSSNLYELMDAVDGDHETIASALFNPETGDL